MLPSCKQEHIYCLDCADKMVKFGSNSNRVPSRVYRTKKTLPNNTTNSNQSSIQCVLCKSISYLDSKSSLKSLRRKQKRKRISDKCSIHDQEFCLFDLDDNELICYVCAGTTHANHNFEALDKAHSIMSKELQEKLIQLSKKRKVFENFIKKTTEQEESIATESENAQKVLKEKMASMRTLLEEKEKELTNSIKKVENDKRTKIQNELKQSQKQLEKIDSVTQAAQTALKQRDYLQFLKQIENNEEDFRHTVLTSEPELKPSVFKMPSLKATYLEQALKNLKYQAQRDHTVDPFGNLSDPYDDQYDNYYEQDEDYNDNDEVY